MNDDLVFVSRTLINPEKPGEELEVLWFKPTLVDSDWECKYIVQKAGEVIASGRAFGSDSLQAFGQSHEAARKSLSSIDEKLEWDEALFHGRIGKIIDGTFGREIEEKVDAFVESALIELYNRS